MRPVRIRSFGEYVSRRRSILHHVGISRWEFGTESRTGPGDFTEHARERLSQSSYADAKGEADDTSAIFIGVSEKLPDYAVTLTLCTKATQ